MSGKKIENIEDLVVVSGIFAAEIGLKGKTKPMAANNPKKQPKSAKQKNQPNPQAGGKKNANKVGYEAKFFIAENKETPKCVVDWRRYIEWVLRDIAQKYNVHQLNVVKIEEANVLFSDNFTDRDWSWNETFFSRFLFTAETVRFNQPWWKDQCINQISIMIWNLVWKTVRETWRETGTYPGAENLPRKIRNSDEGAAEYFATLEAESFEKKFR